MMAITTSSSISVKPRRRAVVESVSMAAPLSLGGSCGPIVPSDSLPIGTSSNCVTSQTLTV